MLTSTWMKSTYTVTDCIESRFTEGSVQVRDSKDPAGPVLSFNREEWDRFINAMK